MTLAIEPNPASSQNRLTGSRESEPAWRDGPRRRWGRAAWLALVAIWASCSSPSNSRTPNQQISQAWELPPLIAIAGDADLNQRVAAFVLCNEVYYCYLEKAIRGPHPTAGYFKIVHTLSRSPNRPGETMGIVLPQFTFEDHGAEIQALAQSRSVIAMPVLVLERGIPQWFPGDKYNPSCFHLSNPLEVAAIESLLQWRRMHLGDIDRHLDCGSFSIAHLITAIEYGVLRTSDAADSMMQWRDTQIDFAIAHDLLRRTMSCKETPIEGSLAIPGSNGMLVNGIRSVEEFLLAVACGRLDLQPHAVLNWKEVHPESKARLIALAVLARRK